MASKRDNKIMYDRTSIERDETGVYQFFWYDGERMAVKKLEALEYENKDSNISNWGNVPSYCSACVYYF